jgi:hypothetical protein
MPTSDHQTEPAKGGLTRRDVLTRGITGAGVATLVWTNPLIKTVALAQTSDGSPSPGGGPGISFVALLLDCEGTKYQVKFEDDNDFASAECDSDGVNTTKHCPNTWPAGGCPPEEENVHATQSDGNVTVHLGEKCTVDDFIVKCGLCCEGPGDGNQPTGQSGDSITFVPCGSNREGCA